MVLGCVLCYLMANVSAISHFLFRNIDRIQLDYIDRKHPSRTPWYLTHTCSVVRPVNKGICPVATSFLRNDCCSNASNPSILGKAILLTPQKLHLCMLDLEYWPMKYLTICSSNIIEGGTRESGCPTMNGPLMMAWDKF